MTCGIYKITNKVNYKIYVGQSVDIEKRWSNHKRMSKIAVGHLYSAIRKYGLDNFLFEVIIECDEHMLDEFEISIIKLYDTTNPDKGYNKTFGGEGGRKTEEAKQNMSKVQKGKTLSDETKQKISKAQKGKSATDEAKKKMSESHRGKKRQPFRDETRKKLSEAKKKQYI